MKLTKYMATPPVEEGICLLKNLLIIVQSVPKDSHFAGGVLAELIVDNLLLCLSILRLRLLQSFVKVPKLNLEIFVGALDGKEIDRLFVLLGHHQRHGLFRGVMFLLSRVQCLGFP